ncbi:hypothetical protein RND71_016830 [Anisodus tanguticus]|uniref:KANL3/Tex30 alpha/beta hydrolase-like domain-containing protein n=1 Tax=Anisodus tanguticus TaxID=243964 RepID=A0AAE1S9A9_9SOLA|nr:hypothetical protein RND71_016830 [Anisodus tanguticus]
MEVRKVTTSGICSWCWCSFHLRLDDQVISLIIWKEMLTKALNAAEVVTFDYPYMSGGKREVNGLKLQIIQGATRDELLLQIDVPVMFVQGSKDGLCPLEKLEAVRKKMKCSNKLYVIDGGDHSFKIGKKHLQLAESTQEEVEKLSVHAIATFVSNHVKEG